MQDGSAPKTGFVPFFFMVVCAAVHLPSLLQKIEKPQRVVLQAITRHTTFCGPDDFCNSAAAIFSGP